MDSLVPVRGFCIAAPPPTGLGMWAASFNNTYRAIDMVPKDVMIRHWHYDRPHKTAVYFAMKGYKLLTCPGANRQLL